MCAQESSLYAYRIEYGYINTNVTIYYLLPNNILQKSKSNTLGSIATERHQNSTDNRSGAITRLEHHIEVLQSLLQLLSNMFD
jgi:hypothetical protein